MFPEIIITENFKLPTYFLSFFVGVVILLVLARRYALAEKFSKYHVLYSAIYSLIGIFVGAKIFYFLSKVPKIITHFDELIQLFKIDTGMALNWLFGGLTFYGGLIGAVLGIFIYCKQYKTSFTELLKIFIPYFPLAHAFGRVGCFLAGCCYGMEYYGPFSIQFPDNPYSLELSSVPRFPVQLVEALINILIFIVLILLRKKGKNAYQLVGAYCIMYSIVRYILEFLRGDLDRGDYGFITTSQFISIFIFISAFLFFKLGKRIREVSDGDTM